MSVKLFANVTLLEDGDVDLSGYLPLTGGTLTGALLVHGSANTLQLKVKGASGQSANLQEWQSSAGAVLAKVGSDGGLTVGASSDAQTFIGPTEGANGYHYDLRYANSGASNGLMLLYMSKTIGATGGVHYAANVSVEISVNSGFTESQLYGQLYSVKKTGAGEINYLRGSMYRMELAGSGIGNNMFGLQASLFAADTSYLQQGYGIHIEGGKASGATFNRMYGIYIEDVNFCAIDNYSIYTKAGDVRLMASSADKLGFHGATPVAQQTVTGSRGGNAALASLLTKLAALGLVVDSSS